MQHCTPLAIPGVKVKNAPRVATAHMAVGRRAYLRGLKSHQIFKPVAFETLGAWDEEAVALLKRITSSLARNQGKDEAETNRFLVQRVAIAIQRGNAVSLADRVRGEVGEEGDAQE